MLCFEIEIEFRFARFDRKCLHLTEWLCWEKLKTGEQLSGWDQRDLLTGTTGTVIEDMVIEQPFCTVHILQIKARSAAN